MGRNIIPLSALTCTPRITRDAKLEQWRMAGSTLDIDNSTIYDNTDEHQVEFEGEVDGDEYQFAVQYSVLEALSGEAPDGDAESKLNQFLDVVKDAALAALSRDTDASMIIVTESDLDQ